MLKWCPRKKDTKSPKEENELEPSIDEATTNYKSWRPNIKIKKDC